MDSLPDAALSHVVAYLPKTTRAIFASALTASSQSWENVCVSLLKKMGQGDRNSMNITLPTLSIQAQVVMACPQNEGQVIHKQFQYLREHRDKNQYDCEGWEVLNFLNVEQRVRLRLRDGDLGGILVSIDAAKKLKVLRIPGCVKIVGYGLAPLCGSLKLQIVDLGLMSAEYESPKAELMGQNKDLVANYFIPIMESIMPRGNNPLLRMHLPLAWIQDPDSDPSIAEAMITNIRGNNRGCAINMAEKRVGCRGCDIHFCHNQFPSQEFVHITVEKGTELKGCPECNAKYCEDYCYDIFIRPQCSRCNKIGCEECTDEWHCDCCNKAFCGECADGFVATCDSGCFNTDTCMDCMRKGVAKTMHCIRCGEDYCSECVVMTFSPSDEGYTCVDCQEEV